MRVAIVAFAIGLGLCAPIASAQQVSGPPLERPIMSLTENGDHQMMVVYHGNLTFDLTFDGTKNWGGTWHMAPDGRFCFTQNGGANAGKEFCKQGRLIGRVSLSGTPLQAAQSNRCTREACLARGAAMANDGESVVRWCESHNNGC